MTPYIVGGRVSTKPLAGCNPLAGRNPLAGCNPSALVDYETTSIRAEDSRKAGALRVFGWSTATVGVRAILGWFSGTRSGNR